MNKDLTMKFSSLNIEKVLSRAQKPIDLLELQFANKLLQGISETVSIESRLRVDDKQKSNALNIDLLDYNRIYHRDTIKQICTDYRLRFLSTKYFKGDIPRKAIEEINRIEKAHNTQLKGFKIMAPSKLFKLEDKDDPLLFAPIGNDYYYLIHKWGNDLNVFRKFMVWPFKSIVNLLILTLIVSFLATWLVPTGLFVKDAGNTEFWIIFFFMFKCIAAVVLYLAFAMGKNFNPMIWNSKYFNA